MGEMAKTTIYLKEDILYLGIIYLPWENRVYLVNDLEKIVCKRMPYLSMKTRYVKVCIRPKNKGKSCLELKTLSRCLHDFEILKITVCHQKFRKQTADVCAPVTFPAHWVVCNLLGSGFLC